jgi:predicted DNA-binding protein (MmcQ/YjbR family)
MDFQNEVVRLRAYALSFPDAYEDHPWGEIVYKVNKKIFVFMGIEQNPATEIYLGVKLIRSNQDALNFPFCKPAGYNLGRSGWVSVQFKNTEPDTPPIDLFEKWIKESYLAVAPKKLHSRMGERVSQK